MRLNENVLADLLNNASAASAYSFLDACSTHLSHWLQYPVQTVLVHCLKFKSFQSVFLPQQEHLIFFFSCLAASLASL